MASNKVDMEELIEKAYLYTEVHAYGLEVEGEMKIYEESGTFSVKDRLSNEQLMMTVKPAGYCTYEETDIWATLCHENVAELLDLRYVEYIDAYLFLTKRYNGTLESLLKTKQFERKDDYITAKRILKDIKEGLTYLHEQKVSSMKFTERGLFISCATTAVIGDLSCTESAANTNNESSEENVEGDEYHLLKYGNRDYIKKRRAEDMKHFGILTLKILTGYEKEKDDGGERLAEVLQRDEFHNLFRKRFRKCKMSEAVVDEIREFCVSCIEGNEWPQCEALFGDFVPEEEDTSTEEQEDILEDNKDSMSEEKNEVTNNELKSKSEKEISVPENSNSQCIDIHEDNKDSKSDENSHTTDNETHSEKDSTDPKNSNSECPEKSEKKPKKKKSGLCGRIRKFVRNVFCCFSKKDVDSE